MPLACVRATSLSLLLLHHGAHFHFVLLCNRHGYCIALLCTVGGIFLVCHEASSARVRACSIPRPSFTTSRVWALSSTPAIRFPSLSMSYPPRKYCQQLMNSAQTDSAVYRRVCPQARRACPTHGTSASETRNTNRSRSLELIESVPASPTSYIGRSCKYITCSAIVASEPRRPYASSHWPF